MASQKTLGEMQREMRTELAGGGAVNVRDALALELLTSYKKFTKVMFRRLYKKSFIIADHHEEIFKAMQDVVDGKCNRLIINMPPRYGKTELVIKHFVAWGFALNPVCKFLHLSYSDTLVEDNSKDIRALMQDPLYMELFPKAALARENGSSKLWATKAGGQFYAVPTKGQVTGFGAGGVDDPEADSNQDPITGDAVFDEVLHEMGARTNVFQGAIIIDDPLKPEDAESETVRETINRRFENTIRSRVNSRKTPIIIIMQRLHEHDLCGYLQETEPGEWRVLSLPALRVDPETGEETALWPLKHTVEELHRKRELDPVVFDTQYQQDPTPREGLMYEMGFQTYTPERLNAAKYASKYAINKAYIDTADKGKDFLCAFCFVDTPEFVYITDVLFTDAPMEVTEPGVAKLLTANATKECLIESNNGGRNFARTVKTLLRTKMGNFQTAIQSFTQKLNKAARIYTNSASVQNDIMFPQEWAYSAKWAKVYKAITTYRRDNGGHNQHDDAPDALTGVWEMHARKHGLKKIHRCN